MFGLSRLLGKDAASDVLSEARPLFLLGFHRGGTTFVQRAINCSQDIHVWGEHGGILTHYRAAWERFRSLPLRKVDQSKVRDLKGQAITWSALDNALTPDDYIAELSRHVAAMFKVSGSRRWGFKEIHYGQKADVDFLCELFPQCRIAMLHRDPVEMFASQYFVHWNSAERAKGLQAFACEFVDSYLTKMANFRMAADQLDNVEIFDVGELSGSMEQIEKLACFAGLPFERFDRETLRQVMEKRVGSSFRGTLTKGIEASPDDVADAKQAIRAALYRADGVAVSSE